MEESRSTESRHMLNITVRKSNFADGVDGSVIWKQDLTRAIARTMQSLPREMMLSILDQDGRYRTSWQSLTALQNEHVDLDEEQVAAIFKVNNLAAAKELLEMKAATITAYASFFNMFGQSSLDVLMADPEFRANDRGNRDPLTLWRRFVATHITEREGKGTLRSLVATKQLLSMFAGIQQTQSESLTDFYERFERIVKALKESELDIFQAWLDDEDKQTGFFLYCLCSTRYGGLVRDISNGILDCPGNIVDLIKIAKDRKESKAAYVHRTKVMIMGENSADRGPLEPYPFLSSGEFLAMTREEQGKLRTHNNAIASAGHKLAKMGWKDGRFWKDPSTKPTDKKPSTDASKKKTSPPTRRRDKEKKVLMAAAVESESEHEEEIVLATGATDLVELHSDMSEYEYSDGDESNYINGYSVDTFTCLVLAETNITDLPDDESPPALLDDESSDDDDHHTGVANISPLQMTMSESEIAGLFAVLTRNANSTTHEGQFSSTTPDGGGGTYSSTTHRSTTTDVLDTVSESEDGGVEDALSVPDLISDESDDEGSVQHQHPPVLVTNPVEIVELADSPDRPIRTRVATSSGVLDLTGSPDGSQGCEGTRQVPQSTSTPVDHLGPTGYRNRVDAVSARRGDPSRAASLHPTSPNHESPSNRRFAYWVVVTGPRTGEIFYSYKECQAAIARKGRSAGGICKGFWDYTDAVAQSEAVASRGVQYVPKQDDAPALAASHQKTRRNEVIDAPFTNPFACTQPSHDCDVGKIRSEDRQDTPTMRRERYVGLDGSIPALRSSSIIVVDSQYRGVNSESRVTRIGRGIVSDTTLEPGQEIAVFNGTRISREQSSSLSVERCSYMLDLEDELEDTAQDLDLPILDCYHEATRPITGCLASMANTASGLYNRTLDTTLERVDNNAAVRILMREGRLVAVLYAISIIPPGEEILWDYMKVLKTVSPTQACKQTAQTVTTPRPHHHERPCQWQDFSAAASPSQILVVRSQGLSAAAKPTTVGPIVHCQVTDALQPGPTRFTPITHCSIVHRVPTSAKPRAMPRVSKSA